MNLILRIAFVGIGATAVMDLYAFLLRQFGVNGLNYKYLGRWIGHLIDGKFLHHSILDSPAIKYEAGIGQLAHYSIGTVFSFLLVVLFDKKWIDNPSLFPALAVGLMTIVAPFFIMQPAFGFGVAGSNLPDPNKARLMSLITHGVYGVGLFISALLMNKIRS